MAEEERDRIEGEEFEERGVEETKPEKPSVEDWIRVRLDYTGAIRVEPHEKGYRVTYVVSSGEQHGIYSYIKGIVMKGGKLIIGGIVLDERYVIFKKPGDPLVEQFYKFGEQKLVYRHCKAIPEVITNAKDTDIIAVLREGVEFNRITVPTNFTVPQDLLPLFNKLRNMGKIRTGDRYEIDAMVHHCARTAYGHVLGNEVVVADTIEHRKVLLEIEGEMDLRAFILKALPSLYPHFIQQIAEGKDQEEEETE